MARFAHPTRRHPSRRGPAGLSRAAFHGQFFRRATVGQNQGADTWHNNPVPTIGVTAERDTGATVTNLLTGTPTRVGVTSVLVCDARSQSRAALTRTVSAIPTVTHIDSVTDDAGLLAAFAAYPAELVLIGIHRSHPSSTRAVDRLLDRYPHAAVLVYGSGQDTAALTAALAHGARRLMLWSPHPGRTTAACSTSPVAAHGPADRDPWPTERELQILRGISRGQTYAAIGRDLLLCEDTIKALSRQLFGKLGARDRPHAVALGIRTGVLDAPRDTIAIAPAHPFPAHGLRDTVPA